LKLYNMKAGMNPRRVRIFLAEKNIAIPMVEVDMLKGENATPEFLRINPLGKLPVLELDDGRFLSESIAICRYIEDLHPAPNLFGANPLERAFVEMWNRRVEHDLMRPIIENFTHSSPFWKGRVVQVPEIAPLAVDNARAIMKILDGELASRPYIAGDRYTVADITAQCAVLVGKNTGAPLPDDLANLGAWWQRVSGRPTARA
jgi:glutathione S-transferase